MTLMDPYMWVDLSSLTKLTQISNNKLETKKKIIKVQNKYLRYARIIFVIPKKSQID